MHGEGEERFWIFQKYCTVYNSTIKKSATLCLIAYRHSRMLATVQSGLGIRSSVFLANRSFFALKCAICSKKRAIHSFAHFWWATWAICSHRSFLVSDLSNSLTSLTKNEGMSKLLILLNKKTYMKHTKNKILDFFCKICLSKSLNRSFITIGQWTVVNLGILGYSHNNPP